MQLLLDRDANIEAKEVDGGTPLHKAAEGGHTGTAQLLLDRRAKIDTADTEGNTALFLAVRY